MNQTMELITRFLQTHPIETNEIVVYDVNRSGKWRIFADRKDMARAIEAFLATEHSIVSNMEIDHTGERYVMTVPYTLGALRYGAFTYNPQKNTLE